MTYLQKFLNCDKIREEIQEIATQRVLLKKQQQALRTKQCRLNKLLEESKNEISS